MKISKDKYEMAISLACMTIQEVSNKSGLSYSTVSRITKSNKNTRPKTIGMIAKALDVSVDEIIDDSEE